MMMMVRLRELVSTAEPPTLQCLEAEAILYSGWFGTWEAVNGLETLPGITSVVFPEHPWRSIPYTGKYIEYSREGYFNILYRLRTRDVQKQWDLFATAEEEKRKYSRRPPLIRPCITERFKI